jgi:hypothetical protein
MSDKKIKLRDCIHDTVYTRPAYPNKGNASILAANLILFDLYITDIDCICELAKSIEKHATYDHEISDEDLNTIFDKLREIVTEHRKNFVPDGLV